VYQFGELLLINIKDYNVKSSKFVKKTPVLPDYASTGGDPWQISTNCTVLHCID